MQMMQRYLVTQQLVFNTVSTYLLDYHVTDPDSNFSDHLPVLGSFCCCNPVSSHVSGQKFNVYYSQNEMNILSFRWDKGDIVLYMQCMLTRDKKIRKNSMLSLTGKGRFGRKSIFDIPTEIDSSGIIRQLSDACRKIYGSSRSSICVAVI